MYLAIRTYVYIYANIFLTALSYRILFSCRVSLSIGLSSYLSSYLSIYLCIYVSMYVSTYLPTYLSTYVQRDKCLCVVRWPGVAMDIYIYTYIYNTYDKYMKLSAGAARIPPLRARKWEAM